MKIHLKATIRVRLIVTLRYTLPWLIVWTLL